MDQATIDETKAKYPQAKLKQLSATFGEGDDARLVEVLVKIPTDGAWRKAMAMSANEDTRAAAQSAFFREHLVWPDGAGLKELTSMFPALPDSFGVKLSEVCGLTKQVEAKNV